ncbi:helicase-related protein [Paraprevotella clara]|uniref:helicase-related protein n=1 Tax=Paraprevotella clara TaxID=454154 RepID=UPI002676366C|nr:helicase-related protein [Paraprevotella clara]
MDKSAAASNAIRLINQAKENQDLRPLMIKAVCSYFDLMKDCKLSQSDKLFMHYLANQAGIPQYYYPMLNVGTDVDKEVCLQTFSNYIQESSLVVGEEIMLHRYQKEVLNMFTTGHRNRYFLSAATSFGKTFLIYEVVRKMGYLNIAFIFPTISLLSENLLKIHTKPEYAWIKESYNIHTLSDTETLGERNIFIFTPERYLSFLDKNDRINLDFVFVDEVYKLDNGFIIDETPQENERDVAYRIALFELLKNENTDALLVGPYIVFPNTVDVIHQSSFMAFLNRYGFIPIDYNLYDIVDKDEIIINTAFNVEVNDTFNLTFTEKAKKNRVIQLVKQLLERGENTIIYCSQKHLTEKRAKELIDGETGLENIDNIRVTRLVNHISNLFIDRKGNQWIVSKALKKGIGIHHGLVPKYIQQEIISLFNEGILKVLICTTTITEGVNTTAKNIIVLSGKKGTKNLKKFDAQNIEGRAGRFMEHYKGRVFIMDNEFRKCINGQDEILQHKFFDRNTEKQDIDIILTDPAYLTQEQIARREQLNLMKGSGVMPSACFEEFRTISYDDKIHLYNTIERFSLADHNKIKELIKRFVGQHKPYNPGLELICQSICPIIKNDKLRFYTENGDSITGNCYLTGMISAFILRGFAGSANYYMNKEQDVDKGIRKAANFVFNVLRYQVVKYFGLFNLLYKHFEATSEGVNIDEVSGIEALLLRLEYSADTKLGRRVSDIGASFKVVEYYDAKENNPENQNMIKRLYNHLDDFEKYNVSKIEQIL